MAEQRDESHFSDLQLLEHDTTIRGPELLRHDVPANAPEPEPEQWEPQVIFDGTGKIAIESSGRGTGISKTEGFQRFFCGTSRKVRWTLAACITTAIIAVTVGVGLGVGLREHSFNIISTPGRFDERCYPLSHLG